MSSVNVGWCQYPSNRPVALHYGGRNHSHQWHRINFLLQNRVIQATIQQSESNFLPDFKSLCENNFPPFSDQIVVAPVPLQFHKYHRPENSNLLRLQLSDAPAVEVSHAKTWDSTCCRDNVRNGWVISTSECLSAFLIGH